MSAQGMKITNFHYTNTVLEKFAPTDYPKWVYPEPMSKQGHLVNDEEEEAEYYAAIKDNKPIPENKPVAVISQPVATVVLSGQNDEKEILLQIAKEKNIQVDARWRTDRIRATIERATPEKAE